MMDVRRTITTTVKYGLAALGAGLLLACDSGTKVDSKPVKETAADYVFTGGKIYTVNPGQPWAEAIAVKGNEIVYVGSAEGVKPFMGKSTEQVDVTGKTILPGFVSAHDHLIASDWTSQGVQIYDAKNKEEALAMIKAYADENPDLKVVQGIGWDKNMLDGLPVATDLDTVVSDRPAIILDNTIHDAWLNTAALKAANITKDTKDTLPGVTYWERDAEGNPTGAAIEIQWFQSYIDMGAWDPERMIPESAEKLLGLAARNGTTLVLVPGIVTPNIKDVHDGMERDFETAMDILAGWEQADKLPVRVQAQPMFKSAEGEPKRFVDFGAKMKAKYNSDLLSVRSLKIHPEGNTVAGTAPHLTPYVGTDELGSFNVEPEVSAAIMKHAAKAGLDVFIHTDGDRSSRAGVDAILAAREVDPGFRGALHHAIWVHPDDQARIIEHKIPVNSTPNFTNTFGNGHQDNLRLRGEEQVKTSLGPYPHLARNGAPVSISADVPSTPQTMQAPLFVMACATTMRDMSDPDSEPFPDNMEPMTIEQAIRAMTIDAAWQLRMEDKVGSLEVGKLADLVVLDQNPLESAPEQLQDINVLYTMMNGRFTHKAK